MARTDILLDSDNIDAITAGGSFTLSTTVEHDPDIHLIPKRARLVLGGRTSDEGSTPAGEIWLATSDGEEWVRRTRLSAGGSGFSEEMVFSVGTERNAGRLKMGRVGDGQPTVAVNAERGTIRLNRIPDKEYPYDTGGWTPQGAISLDAKPARITVGGGEELDTGDWIGESGSIELRTSRNTGTVNIHADGGKEGGEIRLSKSTELSTVIIDGGTGTMVLGASTPGITRSPETENGELWLDDGTGKKFGLKAENGTVGLGPSSDSPGIGLVLKPEEGVFGIVDENGNFVFRVNTLEKKLEILQEYQQDVLDVADPREP
jgi:hypothetical protein